jgi:ABC-type transporter Mla subunit MlaD
VDRLIDSFESTSGSLNATLKKADTLFASLRGTAGDTQALVRDTRGVVKDTGELVRNSNQVVLHTDETIKNANGLVTDTRTFIALNRGQLQEVVNSLNSSLKKLDSTLTEAQGFLADKRLQGDLKETAANVKEATENLKKITVDVRTLTGDPKVQEDLKVTVANLRDATEQAADLFRRVRGVIGGGGKTAKTVAQKVADAQFKADVVRTVNSKRTRFDFDATIPWSQTTFYRAGIFDFGETNGFNIQAGRELRSNVWARYGIHASKLGGGLDFGNPNHPYFSLDVFGLDRVRTDLQGSIPLTSYLDLTLGVDKALNKPDPIFGIRYHK